LTSDERSFIREDYVRYVPDGSIVLHGQCPTGVDAFVDSLCVEDYVYVARCPAPWQGFRKVGKVRQAGVRRNEFLDYQVQLYLQAGHACYALAYPSLSKGTGTQHMMSLLDGLEGFHFFKRDFA
jgi:hypothetical protein